MSVGVMKDYKRNLRASHTLRRYIVYYESIKREPKIRGIYECRCDERLQTEKMGVWKWRGQIVLWQIVFVTQIYNSMNCSFFHFLKKTWSHDRFMDKTGWKTLCITVSFCTWCWRKLLLRRRLPSTEAQNSRNVRVPVAWGFSWTNCP
jgi:hypothetical protein